jgi:outer membrane cobalamin receptor
LNASSGYGSYNTTDTSVGVAGGTDVVSYSVQAGYLDTDGFNASNNRRNASYNRDRDGYYNKNLSANFSVRPARGQEIGVNLLASSGTNRYDANDFSALGAAQNYSSDQNVGLLLDLLAQPSAFGVDQHLAPRSQYRRQQGLCR